MIQRTIPTWQELSWQEELQALITQPEDLIDYLQLDKSLLEAANKAHQLFPLRATMSFVSRIQKGDVNDPLLRQILPLEAELHTPRDYSGDPLDEQHFNQHKGIVHKYHGRVLVIAATHCAINCRYCFRREFDYSSNRLSRLDWHNVLDYIRQHSELSEVILSGGDPLGLPDSTLSWLLGSLADIAHVQRIRVHSRFPIILPSRITPELITIFTQTRLQPVWVIHCNHARELDASVKSALARAATAGITLLNQSVLLKGVNDNTPALKDLSERLFNHKVLPYYLHLLDKVSGASHFDLPEVHALSLYEELRSVLPGYLLPKLVREVAGDSAKRVIA